MHRVKSCTEWELFNVLEKRDKCLVLDLRSSDDFLVSSLWRSINFPVSSEAAEAWKESPTLPSVAKLVDIPALQKSLASRVRRDNIRKVTVYVLGSEDKLPMECLSLVTALALAYGFKADQMCAVTGGWDACSRSLPFFLSLNSKSLESRMTVSPESSGSTKRSSGSARRSSSKRDDFDSAVTELIDDCELFPNCIIDGRLFLGSKVHALCKETFTELGITHVLNVTPSVENLMNDRGVTYMRVALDDVESSDLSAHFDESSAFIQSALEEDDSKEDGDVSDSSSLTPRRVLVHCEKGVSRSSTLIIAYLMKCQGWSLEKAYKHSVSRRSCVRPNTGFVKQLADYERSLFGEDQSTVEAVETLIRESLLSKMMAMY